MRVLFLDTVHEILEQMLLSEGYICEHDYNSDIEEIKTKIKDFDGLVIRSRISINANFLSSASNLKFIARSGAGLENIDLIKAKELNIKVFSSPEGNMDSVGEQAIGMLLMLFNKLKSADAEVRNGIWNREDNRGIELAGKTVGIIGYGNMGSAFAKKLSGFDCNVIAFDKYKTGFSNQFVKEQSLEELQQKSDIISLHLPLSIETHYYIDATFIEKCSKPFYLINTARGQNVNTKDLITGLENGKIAGACLDVLEFEKSSFEFSGFEDLPEDFKRLASSNKVILSPHVAGWTKESYLKLSTFLAEKIIKEFGSFNI